ncbi:hypothetical protein G5I_08011 [Acromyrmex echinatior]|uniref:Uncharacterized protein n=1 Tax=Acromyrmex echinatior TaxID=103372 RepID=F4WQC2_ACREC|nr:hypothetical protein G5I_08011 [Acromyrmex echinatior]
MIKEDLVFLSPTECFLSSHAQDFGSAHICNRYWMIIKRQFKTKNGGRFNADSNRDEEVAEKERDGEASPAGRLPQGAPKVTISLSFRLEK